MQGWIKFHRKFINWQWYDDIPTKTLFVHLLLTANHASVKWRNETIGRGQVVVGRHKLAKDTGLSERQVRTALKKLSETKEILTSKTTNKYSILTICNYSTYQNINNTIDQQNDPQVSSKRPASDQQATTNKNDKNEKNEKKLLYPQQQLSKIVSQWNQFAKQKANPDDIAIEYSYAQAKAKWGDDVLPQAIENYRQALLLPNSQAWEKPLGAFLKDLEKYLPGIFNLNNFDKTNFEKNKKESAVERAKRLEAKNAG